MSTIKLFESASTKYIHSKLAKPLAEFPHPKPLNAVKILADLHRRYLSFKKSAMSGLPTVRLAAHP